MKSCQNNCRTTNSEAAVNIVFEETKVPLLHTPDIVDALLLSGKDADWAKYGDFFDLWTVEEQDRYRGGFDISWRSLVFVNVGKASHERLSADVPIISHQTKGQVLRC